MARTTSPRRRRPVSERRTRAAVEKVSESLGLAMKLARRWGEAGRWRDAAHDLAGVVADLAPELRTLRAARDHGVRGGGGAP